MANTDERNVKRYDLDSDGRASGERVLATLDAGPDGMKVDVNGNLNFAARGGVQIYSPAGALLGRITAPVSPRNLAFGDADFKTLYLVGNAIYKVRLDVAGAVQY